MHTRGTVGTSFELCALRKQARDWIAWKFLPWRQDDEREVQVDIGQEKPLPLLEQGEVWLCLCL